MDSQDDHPMLKDLVEALSEFGSRFDVPYAFPYPVLSGHEHLTCADIKGQPVLVGQDELGTIIEAGAIASGSRLLPSPVWWINIKDPTMLIDNEGQLFHFPTLTRDEEAFRKFRELNDPLLKAQLARMKAPQENSSHTHTPDS